MTKKITGLLIAIPVLFVIACVAMAFWKIFMMGQNVKENNLTSLRSVGAVHAKYAEVHPDETIKIHILAYGKGKPVQPYDIITVYVYNSNCVTVNHCDVQSNELADFIKANYNHSVDIGEIRTYFYKNGLSSYLGISPYEKIIYLKPELKDYDPFKPK